MVDLTGVDRVRLLVGTLLFLLLPSAFVAFAIAFLQFSEAIVVTELSALELIELYVIELALFGAATYLLYRIAMGLFPDAFSEADRSDDDEPRGGRR